MGKLSCQVRMLIGQVGKLSGQVEWVSFDATFLPFCTYLNDQFVNGMTHKKI